MNEYNHTGHPSISTSEYKEANLKLSLEPTLRIKRPVYIKQNPYVGEDGIYVPYEGEEYVPEGCATSYRCVLTKEMFVEAYNKWIKGENHV